MTYEDINQIGGRKSAMRKAEFDPRSLIDLESDDESASTPLRMRIGGILKGSP